MPLNKVSVIIPKREEEDIQPFVYAIEQSAYRYGYEFEIEVVVINIGLERSAQRNEGIRIATGKYLLILDSDQMVSGCLIGECFYIMETNPDCQGIYIPEKVMGKDWFSRLRNWERQFYNGTPVDVVRFVRAEGCPEFDEQMSGPEDSDWDRRIKGEKITCTNTIYHYDNVKMIDFFRKKAYYTKSMKRFAERNPGDKVLNWKWRCFGVFLEQGKWKKFLSRPHLALAVLTLIFARGIIYLWKK